MLTHRSRLLAVRGELLRMGLDGFVLSTSDEHLSEYPGGYAQRLQWLTGFDGSTATAVVLTNLAAMFVDGRYTLQVREQVDDRWTFHPDHAVTAWLLENVGAGIRIGYDPWVHAESWVRTMTATLHGTGASLVDVAINPIDQHWSDRPLRTSAGIHVHPMEWSGTASADKRRAVANWLRANNADSLVLSSLESIAWLFNVRGDDLEHTPVALAFALLHRDGTADLFADAHDRSVAIGRHLGADVRLLPLAEFGAHLESLADRNIAVDPAKTVAAIFRALRASGARIVEIRDPVEPLKAIKNDHEIAGHRSAQLRDGIAVSRFLHWFATHAPQATLCERSAASRLRQFREATGQLRSLSFETISGFGANGAIVHYRVTERTNKQIVPGSLYLVDSGGQYVEGTTDITRTVAVGAPTQEMRDRFTRVLKGHIALASAVFPIGTRGIQLDALARQFLWAAGLDYAHGTGHGVGAYLGVHEAPPRIACNGRCHELLAPGMIVSNEPGFYKAGEYGIRIENLMLVTPRSVAHAEQPMLGFEMLSFVPIDRALIDTTLLTPPELAWVDHYHAAVAERLAPRLEHETKEWLLNVTRPLRT